MNEERILAIRYIIYKVAQDFLLINGKDINDVNYFNENNNFSLNKCLLLPFVVTIANGRKQELMNGVFKNAFLPDVINKTEGVKVGRIENKEFNLFTAENLKLTFFENYKLDFNSFKNLDVNALNIQIREAIDYSFRFLKARRIERFSELNSLELRKLSMFNDAFEFLLEEIDTKTLDHNNKVVLVNKFQDNIMKFPFYLSWVKELENDV